MSEGKLRADLTDKANTLLASALRSQGFDAHYHSPGEKIASGVGQLTLTCSVWEQEPVGPDTAVVTLGVEVWQAPDNPLVIRSMVAGWGASLDEAVVMAIERWAPAVFPAISDAIGPEPTTKCYKMTLFDENGKAEAHWSIYMGKTVLMVPDDNATKALHAALDENKPVVMLIDLLASLLKDPGFERDLFTIKVFLHRLVDGTVAGECSIDMVDWPTGLAVISQFKWPVVMSGYCSFLQFYVFKRVTNILSA